MDESANTVNIDAGGTFTDGHLSWKGERRSVKVPTTPHDLTECFIDCIEKGADALDLEIEQLLEGTDVLRLATTLGTNTIIERSGPKLGLLVTDGHEEDLYGNSIPEDFLVDQELIRGVNETVTPDGTVEKSIDNGEILDEVRSMINAGARMIAVSLGNATYNSTNEQEIQQTIKERYPEHYLRSVPIHLSTEVNNIPDDYRRTIATVINTYLHQQMVKNLYKAEDQVREAGYPNPLLTVHSDGGVARVAKTKAINTYSSGPAAGLIGTEKAASLYGFDSVVATDMGGTSVDVGIIKDGQYHFDMTPSIEGMEVSIPMLRMTSIGAGGGSIAEVENGELSVGPKSAGARPGPVCYGLGGEEPTVTDADLVLGYLNPDYFLGGEQKLDEEAAKKAITEQIADPLGISVEEAALDIKRRIDGNIANDLRKIGERRNTDLNSVDAMFSFGGAGPLHACGYADQAGFNRIVTFPFGSVFNAYGESTMDALHRYTRTFGQSLAEAVERSDRYADTVEEMKGRATLDMKGEGFKANEISYMSKAIVNHPDGHRALINSAENIDSEVVDDIANTYAAQTGVDVAPEQLVLEAVQIVASVSLPDPEITSEPLESSDADHAQKGHRTAYWTEGPRDTPVYNYESLQPGNHVMGPALIEAVDTTYVVPNAWRYRMDDYANGIIERV